MPVKTRQEMPHGQEVVTSTEYVVVRLFWPGDAVCNLTRRKFSQYDSCRLATRKYRVGGSSRGLFNDYMRHIYESAVTVSQGRLEYLTSNYGRFLHYNTKYTMPILQIRDA